MTSHTGSLKTLRNHHLTPRREYLCFNGHFKGELGQPFLQARPNQGPLEDDFILTRGGPQKYSGKIVKMDDETVLSFQLANSQMASEFEHTGSRSQGVTIDGVGSIVDWRKKEVVDKVMVTYVLAENSIQLPGRVKLNDGDKFWVEGKLESVGNDSDGLVVEALHAIHFNDCSELPA
ncbi:hypothetical protein PGTUg99_010463 [Puccinia graminis f. sp. tritici]|uniref:Uncharacterized protein n=1 Tax=Puccinia graminis f. sp. tritici TaxID=56615 RepID=A0A5B0SJ89_PUCGR|nr:hypothetical protein PGTUg99_010463 [Puccinia graminis f. sp. tritici]